MVYVTTWSVVEVLDKVCAIELPDPALAPVTLALTLAVHVKVVPVTLDDKVMPVTVPEQIVCKDGVAVTFGVGLTNKVYVAAVPGQATALLVYVGVTVYTTDPWVLLGFTSVMAGRLPLPLAVKPVIPLAVAPFHAKAVLAAAVEAVKLTAADSVLEQMVWFSGVLVTVALGLTVMVTVMVGPSQDLPALV
jgi:hypothetical protein